MKIEEGSLHPHLRGLDQTPGPKSKLSAVENEDGAGL